MFSSAWRVSPAMPPGARPSSVVPSFPDRKEQVANPHRVGERQDSSAGTASRKVFDVVNLRKRRSGKNQQRDQCQKRFVHVFSLLNDAGIAQKRLGFACKVVDEPGELGLPHERRRQHGLRIAAAILRILQYLLNGTLPGGDDVRR